jgi:hypothetical protein
VDLPGNGANGQDGQKREHVGGDGCPGHVTRVATALAYERHGGESQAQEGPQYEASSGKEPQDAQDEGCYREILAGDQSRLLRKPDGRSGPWQA